MRISLCTLTGNLAGAGGSGGYSVPAWPYASYPRGGAGGPGGPGAVYCSLSSEFVSIACTIVANSGGRGGRGGSGVRSYNGQSGDGGGGAGGGGGVSITPEVSASVINTLVGSNLGGAGGAGAPAGSIGAPDVEGSFNSLGHNLVGQTDGSLGFSNGVNGDVAGSASAPVDPIVGPLADNGGPTFTMALLHGSPALDAGEDELLRPDYGLRDDQRGLPRKSGSHVDIGSFEFQVRNGSVHSSAHAPALALSSNGNLQPQSVSTASASDAPVEAPSFKLTFSDNSQGATFTVLATTNISLPANNWSVLGQALQIAPGLFQFTDVETANNPQRFYRVTSP